MVQEQYFSVCPKEMAMHLKGKKPRSIQELEKKLRTTWKLMLLMSSSVLSRNLPIFEVCDLEYDSVVTAMDLGICNISVLTHYYLEGSGKMRTLPLYNCHNLDNMNSLHSSLDRQDKINNREQDYGVIHVASLGTLLGTASRNLILLRLCFGKRWGNSGICRTR